MLDLCFDNKIRGDSGFTQFSGTLVRYVVIFQDTYLPICMALDD